MKFRVKVTVCMICLMTLLFSFGSCALISCSFQVSLDREQANAEESCQLLLNTLQAVGSIQPWISATEFSDTPGADHPPTGEPLGWGAADQSGQDLLLHWLCRFCPLPAGSAPQGLLLRSDPSHG